MVSPLHEEGTAMRKGEGFAEKIQRLAYETLLAREEREERPADVRPDWPPATPSYAAWSPTSFAGYVPFRGPEHG
jgi:hypothetical protein